MAVLLDFIVRAQLLGFSLAEIQSGISEAGSALPSGPAIMKALQQKSGEIDKLLKAANEKKHAIALLLDELACLQ